MKSDDRNTALIVALVLVVCTISLILVGTYTWQLIAPAFQSVGDVFGTFVKRTTASYNFLIPERDTVEPFATNYNFKISDNQLINYDEKIVGRQSSLVDQIANTTSSAEYAKQIEGYLRIPSIGITSPIYSGVDIDSIMNRGVFLFPDPSSSNFTKTLLICQRAAVPPIKAGSCWNIDQVESGDEIFVEFGYVTNHYQAISVNFFPSNEPGLLSIPVGENVLKIVSNHPVDGDNFRIVVLAELVERV